MLKRYWKRILLGVLIVLALAVIGFVVWANSAPPPMAEALTALESDAAVTVTSDRWITFMPAGEAPTTGFVFYPGGRVDARSYAPMARAVAEAGHLVVIPPMPLNLAIFGLNAADGVIAAHPEVQHWAIGGHSLGGAMAARYVLANPDDDLILMAAFADQDMSALPIQAMSIYGTLDGLATVATIEESRAFLPPDTEFVRVEGGNHAQFGWYGDQAGDNPAAISREDQTAQTVAAVTRFLAQISGR